VRRIRQAQQQHEVSSQVADERVMDPAGAKA